MTVTTEITRHEVGIVQLVMGSIRAAWTRRGEQMREGQLYICEPETYKPEDALQ